MKSPEGWNPHTDEELQAIIAQAIELTPPVEAVFDAHPIEHRLSVMMTAFAGVLAKEIVRNDELEIIERFRRLTIGLVAAGARRNYRAVRAAADQLVTEND